MVGIFFFIGSMITKWILKNFFFFFFKKVSVLSLNVQGKNKYRCPQAKHN